MNLCKLCKVRNADKENSHIIPKFLGKPLFRSPNHRAAMEINKGGRNKKIQDIPKEDFILCSNCEQKFSILETYFARKLKSINDFKNRKNDFRLAQVHSNNLLIPENLDPIFFKLFSVSLFWRTSISTLFLYEKFKLPELIEEELRVFLSKNLREKHRDLIEVLPKIKNTPNYHFVVFKPEFNNRDFIGGLTAYQTSKNIYTIFTSDLVFQFYSELIHTDPIIDLISNLQNEEVRIILSSNENWKALGSAVIKKVINSPREG